MYKVETRKKDREQEKIRIKKLLTNKEYNTDGKIREDENGEYILFIKNDKFGNHYEIKFYVWR